MSNRRALSRQAFLTRFFGEGNLLDLGDPKQAKHLQPWIQRVWDGKDRVLLPRQEDAGKLTWYALADTARSARAFREELLAAVGSSYTDFQGASVDLRRSDPVEAAILDFSGRHAFKLSVVDPLLKDACRRALERMLSLHDGRPPSKIHSPRIPGLILRDLELALQQRDRPAADEAIEELRAGGHLDGQNLRFLDIRRWEAFDEWTSIHGEVDAGTILELRRPARITQALLRAVYRLELASFEDGVRTSEALEYFQRELQTRIISLLETREGMSAPEVAKLFMLKAAAIPDPRLRDSLLEGSTVRGAEKVYLQALADLVRSPETIRSPSHDEATDAYLDGDKDRAFELLVAGSGGERRMGLLLRCALELGTLRVAEIALGEFAALPAAEQQALKSDPRVARQLRELEERYTAPSAGVPKSWLDWVRMVSAGVLDDNKAAALAQQGAEEWSLDELVARPGDAEELAEALRGVGEQWKRQLRLALPHLHAFLLAGGDPDSALQPVLHSLLELYAFDDARSENTWRAAAEVLEALVRCGLNAEEYAEAVELLDVLLEDGLPWKRVDEALDLLEALVILAPGQDTTMRAAGLMSSKLQRWKQRLGKAQIELFNQLGRELGTGTMLPPLEQERAQDEQNQFAWLADKVVAVYSLNERALARVKGMLEDSVSGVRVRIFDDKVGGGNALRQAARTADIFLVATGAAKHAATEFIDSNRGEGLVTLRTHGKGSASLLRLLATSVSG